MSESTKTGVFWGVALVMLAIAAIVAWPTPTNNERIADVGRPMFEEFKDPLTAASLKVVTFDELQGQLDTFEVRKDRTSGIWTIPSRNGYPADALEHMRDAANALVALKILDIQTENAEDHDDLGVVEPKLEDLEVGDEGVGRLVTFKDESQKTLASIIVGKPVANEPGKVYVRKPGQDPVYVVKFDDAPLGTRFQDWIEDDLLKLSSIDIAKIEIKDYSAALAGGRQLSLSRNYTATVEMDGSQWKLGELLSFDPTSAVAAGTKVEVPADKPLNTTKLNDMKSALDDLKIVNVLRKPDGMSANLRANKDLLSDDEAVRSLMTRGFIPASTGGEEDIEILAANGELIVGLKDGVEYSLRFGNASGLSEDDEQEAEAADGEATKTASGVNRYLLVTARVNEAHFPPPDLKSVPQSLEELEEMQAAEAKANEPANEEPANEEPAAEAAPSDGSTPSAEMPATEPAVTEEPAPEDAANTETEAKQEMIAEPKADQPDEPTETGDASPQPEATKPEPEAAEPNDSATDESEPATENSSQVQSTSGVMLVSAQDDAATSDEPSLEAPAQAADAPAEKAEELSADEKLERLEAEQEKITKENQRKIDERKDKMAVAERRVRELNARFADWYYVIAEDTYRKLRISRDELFTTEAAQNPADAAAPNMQFGAPGGFPGFPGQQ